MGSVDKLIKALETLRIFQQDPSDDNSLTVSKKKAEPLGNKEKITGCNTLADCICSPIVRATPEFPNFVGIVIETLLTYANDKESDVRMVSDECLNRITRVLLDTNLGRLQIEFYKELKKNGPSRCVRSALWRFAELAPLIRPQKRRAFVVNLLTCVVKMAERHEEALQECLMSAMSNISSTLMSFAADSEVKAYLAPFITNLCSTSAVVRRVGSTCASLIALHSRKPLQFFSWLLVQVLDMVLPIMHSTSSENLPIMLGCLHSIRLIIPLLDNEKVTTAASMSGTDVQSVVKLDTTIMLFELIVHCLQQAHPSITTAALECYQQLLKTPTLPGFIDLILMPGSISTSVLAVSYEATLAAVDPSATVSEPELAISDTDSNPPIDELNVNLSLQSDFLSTDPQTSPLGIKDESCVDAPQRNSPNRLTESAPVSDSCSSPDGFKNSEHIGTLTDSTQPPIMYSARLLCQTFLLTGNTEERLFPDREVRVSIKSLALSCMSHIMRIYPQSIQARLYISEQSDTGQCISDILLYHSHLDPQLQGTVALVLGNLIHARVSTQHLQDDTHNQDLESYIQMLTELLDNDNSMGIRLALSAVRACVNSLLNSSYHESGIQLLDKSFQHSANSYWLVRVDLIELVSELDMLPLIFTSGSSIQTVIMEELVIKLLGDSDYRVRQAAGISLVKLIPKLFYGSDHPHQSVLLARANSQLTDLLYPFLSEFPTECPPFLHGLPFPYPFPRTGVASEPSKARVESVLSKVIYRLVDAFSATSSQYTKLGVVYALYELSTTYPATKYPYAWSCAMGTSCLQHSKSDQTHSTTSSLRSILMGDELRQGSGGGPLTLVMSLLTSSSLSLDLTVHQHLLALAGSLIAGDCFAALQRGQTNSGGQDKRWPGIYDRLLVPNVEKLLSHLIRLLNIYAHVLEDTSLIGSSNPKAVLDAAREAITSPLKKKTGSKQEPQANETQTETPKSTKVCVGVIASAHGFSITYRVPAGVAITIDELEMGGAIRLTDVFVSWDIDYNHCQGQKPYSHHIDDGALRLLISDLQNCVTSRNCDEIVWSDAEILEVKCNENDTEIDSGTAVYLICSYNISVSVLSLSSVNSLEVVASEAKENCKAGSQVEVSRVLKIAEGNAQLPCSLEPGLRSTRKRISDLINDCKPPCRSLNLLNTWNNSCSNLIGRDYNNSLTPVDFITQVVLFYECVEPSSYSTTTVKEELVQPDSSEHWRAIAISFIVLFVFALIISFTIFTYFWKFKMNASKFPALENNNNSSSHANRERQQAQIRPYAVSTVSSANKKSAGGAKESEAGAYVPDVEIHGRIKENIEHSVYEQIDSDKGNYEEMQVRSDNDRHNYLTTSSREEAEKALKNKKETLGTFNHIPFYVNLHDAVKGAHLNYKVSLSLSKMDKFTNTLQQILNVFSQLLEMASLQEIGKCTEEILEYLKSIVVASPVATVALVHQMLKALFGTNLSSQYEELVEKKVVPRSQDTMSAGPSVVKPGLFSCCLSTPYAQLSQSFALNPFRVESEDYHNTVYIIKKCEERKMPAVLKTGASVDKNTVGVYIRLFEPLVIKSLKMYTMSSSVQLQTEVLNLLVQLIQLRVNYCLLDNDEIFLSYVLKQVDMISEGPPRNSAGLIRCIFRLLLLLSYEKLHSKTLVMVPRIMQLCDGVMASGQNPLTHAIPALEMLVKDLFLCRSTNTSGNADTAFHDIETQREVTASMLLRLVQHTQVLGLLSVVLYQLMRESEEKWKKLSRQVIDLLLPLATNQKIVLETREGMHALHNILLAVSPSVYRPVDMLLKALFKQQKKLDTRASQQRWMSTVLALLRVLLSIGKEEVILSRLNELDITFDTSLMLSSYSLSSSGTGRMYTSQDSMISSSQGTVQPQEILASFLLQVIGFCTENLHIDVACSYIAESDYTFSLQQFSLLLLNTSYMLQSGHFRKVAKFMMEQLASESSHLHHLVLKINMYLEGVGTRYPTITLQWSYILMLLNYNDQTWWRQTLRTYEDFGESSSSSASKKLPINEEIIKCAGLAMYCDYVVENIHDAEHLTWLTVNHVNDIVEQLHEAPVHDFMSAVYGNSSASGLFISAIQSRYKMDASPSKLYKLVTCLRSMHKDQSGLVVLLLTEKMLSVGHSGIGRLADSVACRRLEVLLAETEETVHKQLSEDDITKILVILQGNKRKHRRLLALVEKLRSRFYPTVIPPLAFSDSALASLPSQLADKDFYLYITKLVCSNVQSSPRLCASLLGSLEAPDILSIMLGDSFQVRCLAECIKHGADKSVRSDTGTVISDRSDSSHSFSPLLTASETLLKSLWKKVLPSLDSDPLSSSMDESATAISPSLVSIDVVLAICAYLDFCSPTLVSKLDQSELKAICGIAFSYFDMIKTSVNPSMMQSSMMTFSWASQMDELKLDRAPTDVCQLSAHLFLLSHVLKHGALSAMLSENITNVFTIIDSVTQILRLLRVGGLTPELENYRETLVISQDGYIQVSQLVTCLSDVLLAGKSSLPAPLISLLNSVIVGLARLPCVNEHARMPVTAFVLSSESRNGSSKPQLKVDALQDTTVLREFIKRSNLLGWISRAQFEETWACLLHLLSPVAVIGTEDIAAEEDVENIEWMVSALRGITGLLCHTLNRQEPGNPLYTCYTHQHRQRPLQALQSTAAGQKLQQVRSYLDGKFSQKCDCMSRTALFCTNIERLDCRIGYNQLSVDYLTQQLSKLRLPSLLMSDIEKADVEHTEKSSSGNALIDTASCLKLLMDVYSHLLSPAAKPRTPLMLLNECVKSTVMLSDLFHEKSQYEWMYSTFWALSNHHSGEDELMNQYMLLGLCKAAALHSIESGAEEKLHKLIEGSLKSTHIPTRLAAVYGSFYLLERGTDQVKPLLPILLEFLNKNMAILTQKSHLLSELYSLSVWSLTFFIIEHYQESLKSHPLFIPKVIQAGIQSVNNCENSCTLTRCSAILSGFERALLTNSEFKQEGSFLLKLASDRLALPAMHSHLQSVLGLLVTCMYTDQPSQGIPEQLSMAEDKLELISILFDRIRRGLPHEADIITGVLPSLMTDLFTSQDIMNKVIGEFLSEQQPHLTLIARTVYEVFEQQATVVGGATLLHDWVLLSITSFTQRNPLSAAIWSLTCFFVSASSNHWLRGLFPFISSRIGLLEPVDEIIFLLSCKDFYGSVAEDSHKKQTLISVFQSAARTEQIYKTALDAMK
ncbi:huntingtin-like [Watersipora subatra]|uniref:huntingtin-like n=1 Tax=Watersipora subatra TaxID=2589382 RepID=UPI00355C10FC